MKSMLALACVVLLSACATAPQPQMTPLEIQSLQTREYETNKKIGFAATLSVFQDLGYIVESADVETGFITAESPTATKTDWWFTGNKYSTSTRATAFIEELRPDFTRIRLNFVIVNATSTTKGQASDEDKPVLDAQVYQNAFNRIEDAIFVRSGTD